MPAKEHIKELDGLRALAILMVLGCHYEGFSSLFWGAPKFGWLGVDLFFALSGYLITAILLKSRNDATPYRTFYARRFFRILPPYLLVVAIVAAVRIAQHKMYAAWIWTQALFVQGFSYDDLHALRLTLTHPIIAWTNLASLHAGRLPIESAGAPLTVLVVPYILWSLSVEEYFYVLWAPVILRLKNQWVLAVSAAIVLCEPMLRWSVGTPSTYYSVPFRFDALIYGALLAVALDHWRTRTATRGLNQGLAITLAGALLALTVVLGRLSPVLNHDVRASTSFLVLGMPSVGVSSACLIGLLILNRNSANLFARTLRSAPLQFIGRISYGMYLLHLIAGACVRLLFGIRDEHHQTLLQAVLATVLTIGMAWLSFKYIERPTMRWKNRRFPAQLPTPPKIAADQQGESSWEIEPQQRAH